MGFLAPWFLAGLAAVGVPVFVHLLRRQTTTPRPFSSLMFFERGTQSSTKHRRLRYLLLFALRTAMLILLVLAFANPFIRRAGAGTNGTLLMLVVDDSFSMRAGAPQTRLDEARQAALRVLVGRPGGQRAQIMSLGAQLQVLTQPLQDTAALQAAVEGIQPTDTHGSFGELGRGLRALEEASHAPVELHLFSDMQRGNMPANFADMVLPANVKLILHSLPSGNLASPPSPNWTVESVEAPAELADPKDRRVSHVKATVVGFNTPAVSRTVSLLVDGKTIATRRVDIPANGRASVQFEPLDVPYGFSRCQVRIDSADGFPADDAALFSVRRSDPERVLFVQGGNDTRSPLYFGAALSAAAASSFVLQTVNADQTSDLDPSKYAFVVLSDVSGLPSLFANTLLRAVRGGEGVLIAMGTSAGHGTGVPMFGGSLQGTRPYSRDGGFARIGSSDVTHPVLQAPATASGQTSGTVGPDWSDAKFYFASIVDPAGARVFARLADGTPLLLDKSIGEGHVLLFTSGMDNLTNDLPLHPVFVPFVDRAARYLTGSDRLSGSRTVGAFAQLRAPGAAPEPQGRGVEVIDPDGKRPLSLREASTAQSYELNRSGFYQIHYANGRDALVGVNPDRRESDLAPMPADVLHLWSGGETPPPSNLSHPSPISGPEAKRAYTLWWYVMLLALAAAIAESIAANFFLGTQREEP